MAVQLLLCRVLALGMVQYCSHRSCVIAVRFFSKCLVSINVVYPCSSIDTTAVWKKMRFILSVRSDFHMTKSLSIAVHAFANRLLMSVSVDETLLPRKMKLSSSFGELPFRVEMSPL